MSIPTLKRFCCCLTLKSATTICAFGGALLDKGIACLIHHGHIYITNDSTIPLIILYVIMSLSLITTFFMMIGSAMRKRELMLPYLIFSIIDIHITAVMIWYGIFQIHKDVMDYSILAFIVGSSGIVFAIYYWIIVYSRFKQIHQEEMNENLIEEHNDEC